MSSPPYPLHPQPFHKSWIERHPRWKIPLGCLTLVVLVGGFVALLFAVILSSFHHSEVYQQALLKAQQNPQVREQLGEPIRTGWFIAGQLHVSGSRGNADLCIPISGPRGKGSIRAVATKTAGVWRFSVLQVSIEGQTEPVDLLSIEAPGERDF